MSNLTRYRKTPCPYYGDKCIDPDSHSDYIEDDTLQQIADAWNLFTHTQWKADIRTFNPQLGELLDGLVIE